MNAQKKFGKKLPTVEVVIDTLEDITPLYNSCDAVVSASSSEGFGLPLLEGLLLNKIIISPNCTGQLDFLNKENSLLVDVKEIIADERYQYWKVNKGAKIFMPNSDHLSQQMINAYKNYKQLSTSLFLDNHILKEKYTWNNAAKQIEDLIK